MKSVRFQYFWHTTCTTCIYIKVLSYLSFPQKTSLPKRTGVKKGYKYLWNSTELKKDDFKGSSK